MRSMILATCLAMATAVPAAAQVNPVVDPTVMTGWAGGAAAQQQVRKRYGLEQKRSANRCSYYARNPAYRCKSARRSRSYRR